MPGLIEGAHLGRGLGIQFLRHIERTRVLVFLIDCTGAEPREQYETLVNELGSFNKDLLTKPRLIALSKMDLADADARKLLGWALELGANFVRLAHYPHDEHVVRAADEMGLLVWAEIPVYWTIDWENRATFENARNQLTEVITRDRNRASVVLWSVGNETPVTPSRLRFMRELVGCARKLDPTRLVSAALERQTVDPHTERIDDPLGADLDVLGCNEYLGWYVGLPDRPDGVRWTTRHDKPLIMTELGADALHGHHGDELTRWTEEYQAAFYEHQIRMLEGISFLRGMSPWILADFRSPRRPLPGVQDGWNRKGLLSDRGERKLAFGVLQAHYRELAGRGR
jgi:beta-glucuronidase